MKILAAVLISATIMVTGCKKAKDGKDGTQGPQGPAGVVPTSTDGFIKGTIIGTRRDGTSFNENFNYTNYWDGPSATLDSTSLGYTFQIIRGTDYLSADYANFNITVTTLTATTGVLNIGGFTYTKSLGANKLFKYELYPAPTSINGLSYNQSTGVLTGNYSINLTGSDNNTAHSGTFTGSFQATVTKLYYRTINPSQAPVAIKQN